jgi:hypothetical protein
MGIISSPRPLHILEVSRAMIHVMDPELQEIDRELTLIFKWYLTVADLQLKVFVVAEQLGKRCPKEQPRGLLLGWLHIKGPQTKIVMPREFLGTSELMTRGDS